MKQKLGSLLIIGGAALGGFRYNCLNNIPSLLICAIGGFLIGFSYLLFTSAYSGIIWGITIKSSILSKMKTLIGAAGLFIGGFALTYTFLLLFTSLFGGRIGVLLINLIAYLVTLAIGPLVGKIVLEKTLARENSAAVIGELPLFQQLHEDLSNAQSFVVGFEGIALFSSTDYCYAVYRYEDYELGDLQTPQDVAMVGTYFVQKYSDIFTFKVDVTVIPGSPGLSAIKITPDSISIAKIRAIADKRLFKSYIFTRK
ncbi:MAG: hypothetical protein E7618_00610 [Ruminococcaceae bacterium]|nr:hypothetical protein [Oscillospiraceae bacterium]